MRTEILQQVALLQLESTFLHLRQAAAANKLQPLDSGEGRMWSNDSQVVSSQYQDDCEHQGCRGQLIISVRAAPSLLYGGFNLCKSQSLLRASLSDHGQT